MLFPLLGVELLVSPSSLDMVATWWEGLQPWGNKCVGLRPDPWMQLEALDARSVLMLHWCSIEPHLATPSAQARPTGCSRAQSLCLGLRLRQAHGLGSRYRCSWPRTSSHPTVVWIATGCRATSSACWLGHKRWPSKTEPGLVKHRWIYNEFHGLAQKWRMYLCPKKSHYMGNLWKNDEKWW